MDVTLLFTGTPEFDLDDFSARLAARLGASAPPIEELSPMPGCLSSSRIGPWRLDIGVITAPLAAGNFRGAMESPLSRPFRGVLSDTIARHRTHATLALRPQGTPPDDTVQAQLEQIRLLHAATLELARAAAPSAVHWEQSNQLLTGAQYLSLADQPTPWALIAKAQVSTVMPLDHSPASHGLRLPEARLFIGRPVEFSLCDLPLEEMHAASLAFLRHALETGSPVPDGESFGAAGGRQYKVRHVEPAIGMPEGIYELSLASCDAGTAPDRTARRPGATPMIRDLPDRQPEPDTRQNDTSTLQITPQDMLHKMPAPPAPTGLTTPKKAPPQAPVVCADVQRTRSIAISFLVLAISPPLGAFLLLTNAFFGPNTWRTGLIATAFVGMAMIVGAYTFLEGIAPKSARLSQPAAVVSGPITE